MAFGDQGRRPQGAAATGGQRLGMAAWGQSGLIAAPVRTSKRVHTGPIGGGNRRPQLKGQRPTSPDKPEAGGLDQSSTGSRINGFPPGSRNNGGKKLRPDHETKCQCFHYSPHGTLLSENRRPKLEIYLPLWTSIFRSVALLCTDTPAIAERCFISFSMNRTPTA